MWSLQHTRRQSRSCAPSMGGRYQIQTKFFASTGLLSGWERSQQTVSRPSTYTYHLLCIETYSRSERMSISPEHRAYFEWLGCVDARYMSLLQGGLHVLSSGDRYSGCSTAVMAQVKTSGTYECDQSVQRTFPSLSETLLLT